MAPGGHGHPQSVGQRLPGLFNERKLYVSLTPAGLKLYESAQAQVEEAYRQIEAEFTVEKMRQLTALLEEFIALGNGAQGEEEA